MTRLGYLSSTYMPLLCSSRGIVVSSGILVIFGVYSLMYLSSNMLFSRYPDNLTTDGYTITDGNTDHHGNGSKNQLFIPNSQDYFRTCLLGIFPPLLLNFMKNFFFNFDLSNKTYKVVLNLVSDLLVHDWFLFLIIFFLAYPQVESTQFHTSMTTTNTSSEDDDIPSVWHIIPKQSYIFGISWSLSQLVIAVLEHLSYYQELPLQKTTHEEQNQDQDQDQDQEQDLEREPLIKTPSSIKAALSAAPHGNQYGGPVKTKSRTATQASSALSIPLMITGSLSGKEASCNNSSDIRTQINLDTCTNALKSATMQLSNLQHDGEVETGPLQGVFSNGSQVVDGVFEKKNKPEEVLYVDFKSNFIGYQSIEDDRDGNKGAKSRISRRLSNLTRSSSSYNNDGQYPAQYFYRIESTRELCWALGQCFVVVFSDVLFVIGQSLISSIYFIYVPGHDSLFTPLVNYFGSRDFAFFMLHMMIPFTIVNFCTSGALYFWSSLKKEYELMNKDLDTYFPALYENNHSSDGPMGKRGKLSRFLYNYETEDYYQNVINDIQQQSQQSHHSLFSNLNNNLNNNGVINHNGSRGIFNPFSKFQNKNIHTGSTLLPISSIGPFPSGTGNNHSHSNTNDISYNTHRNMSVATGEGIQLGHSWHTLKTHLFPRAVVQWLKTCFYYWKTLTLKMPVVVSLIFLYSLSVFVFGIIATITVIFLYFDHS